MQRLFFKKYKNLETYMDHTVHITGCGVFSPLGHTVEEHLTGLREGISCITRCEDENRYPGIEGRIPPFKAREYIKDRKAIKVMTKNIILSSITAGIAIKDAGLSPQLIENEPNENGVIWGGPTTVSGVSIRETAVKSLDEKGEFSYDLLGDMGYRQLPPLWIIPKLPNTGAGQISIQNGLKGFNYTVVNGSNNGIIAIQEAFQSLQAGESTRLVCGAAEGPAHSDNINLLKHQGVASITEKGSRSFSSESDGHIISEGGAAFLLETEEAARKRGAGSYGKIRGCRNLYHPDMKKGSVEDIARIYIEAMEGALEDSGLAPKEVDFIQASGYGINKIDLAEALAIKTIFGKDVPVTCCSSTIGYPLAAAGPIALLSAILQINNGFLPPIQRSEGLFYSEELDYIIGEPVSRALSVGLCNSFGYDGSACTMVVGSAENLEPKGRFV